MQGGGTHQLHVECALAEGALSGLTYGGEGLREEIVQSLAISVALPELVGQSVQLGIAHIDEFGFDRVDLLADPLELAEDPAFASAKDTIDYGWHFSSRSSRIV
jgi:hypothetical protein